MSNMSRFRVGKIHYDRVGKFTTNTRHVRPLRFAGTVCNNPYKKAAKEALRPENASANMPERRGVGGVPAWERDASCREEVPLCRRADREGGAELFDPQQIQRIGVEEALGRMPVAAFVAEAPSGKLVFVNDSARRMLDVCCVD